jgi:hypothetical protein
MTRPTKNKSTSNSFAKPPNKNSKIPRSPVPYGMDVRTQKNEETREEGNEDEHN